MILVLYLCFFLDKCLINEFVLLASVKINAELANLNPNCRVNRVVNGINIYNFE